MERAQPNLGIRIRKLRLDKGLSQRKLAALVGLTEGQVSNIERGRSWTGELSFALFADALGVTQHSLTDYSQNDAFIKTGGLSRRSSREAAALIVRRGREILISVRQRAKERKP